MRRQQRLDFVAQPRQFTAVVLSPILRAIDQRIAEIDGAEQDIGAHGRQRLLSANVVSPQAFDVALYMCEVLDELIAPDEPQRKHNRESQQQRYTHARLRSCWVGRRRAVESISTLGGDHRRRHDRFRLRHAPLILPRCTLECYPGEAGFLLKKPSYGVPQPSVEEADQTTSSTRLPAVARSVSERLAGGYDRWRFETVCDSSYETSSV